MNSKLKFPVYPAHRCALAAILLCSLVLTASAQQTISTIQGLKWRNTAIDEQNDQFAVTFETQGQGYVTSVGSLNTNGFDTVVLKVANMSELPSGTTTAQRDAEVITLLTDLYNKGFHVYLWKRQWLQESGTVLSYQNQGSGGEYGADSFIADMSDIINSAVAAGVDSALEGVAVIETNLEKCDNTYGSVQERTLYIAEGINAATNNWLTSHTLMMPGAGMGCYFVDIGSGQYEWIQALKAQTGGFAFIYKHMESQPSTVCSLGTLNTVWEQNVGFNSTLSVDQQVSYLRDDVNGMGLSDLETYVNYWASYGNGELANWANVVFWGDLDDGICSLSAYAGIEAVHKELVENNGWTGFFFDFPFGAQGATGTDLWRYVITVGPSPDYARALNRAENRANTATIWAEWHDWASSTPLNYVSPP